MSNPEVKSCEDLEFKRWKYEQEQNISFIKQKWPLNAQESYEKLYRAADVFFEKEAEINGGLFFCGGNMGCTGRGYAHISGKKELLNEFYQNIVNEDKFKKPTPINISFNDADYRLNSEYKNVIKTINTIKTKERNDLYQSALDDGIKIFKEAEIAWIKYRDAWNEFMQSMYPNYIYDNHLEPNFFKVAVTLSRSKRLNDYSTELPGYFD